MVDGKLIQLIINEQFETSAPLKNGTPKQKSYQAFAKLAPQIC